MAFDDRRGPQGARLVRRETPPVSAGFLFGQSDDPTSSRADIERTCTIMDVATPLGIVVHDHIVIDRDGHASMKG